MKALFIGGTGTISIAIIRKAVADGWEVWLLNRGNRAAEVPEGVRTIVADIYDEGDVSKKLEGMTFDVVSEDSAIILEHIFDFVYESLDLCCRVTAADNEIISERCFARDIYGLDIDTLL